MEANKIEANDSNPNTQTEWEQIISAIANHTKRGDKWKQILDQHENISYDDAQKLDETKYQHAAHGISVFFSTQITKILIFESFFVFYFVLKHLFGPVIRANYGLWT